MAERVFLNAHHIANFLCPQCEKLWKKDLSALQNLTRNTVVNCKCPCGHVFPVVIERRRFPRKSTNLGGAFIHDKKKTRGVIVVKNISFGGLGFELTSDYRIATGDVVLVRFNLDDPFGTLVARESLIRKIRGRYVGAEFLERVWKHDLLHLYLEEDEGDILLI